ncbi:TPA: helix-turn-helix transcriptional regulator [Morganella morganii]|uniref:helix-turn-helix domain-containing protein n=1 Tax=Morganella morganii TaxID=582 RepID=UPI00046AE046|nr:helix-turn-helix transcriptional regulator [Morganella morganii]HDF2344237.1 helix-turn-helix transcriptional regulator [Morganella morganii]
MNDISAIVGKRIKEIRQYNGMNISDIAEKTGLSHQQLSRYERGVNKICADTLYKISLVFECSVNDLFSDLPFREGILENNHFYNDTSAMIDDYFHGVKSGSPL